MKILLEAARALPARARPELERFLLVLDPCSSYQGVCSLVLVLAGRVSRCSRAILVARRPLVLAPTGSRMYENVE